MVLGVWSVCMWMCLVSLLLLAAYSVVGGEAGAQAHDKSRYFYLTVWCGAWTGRRVARAGSV